MDGFRVFLRGEPRIDLVLASLQLQHPFAVLDGPIGSTGLVGVRAAVLVELCEDHDEPGGLGRYPLLVRFTGTDGPERAWRAAHAFLWTVTRGGEVDEALLLGPGTAPLRYHRGRIAPVRAVHSED
ncbi:hypothetical protein GCM10027271_09360 [Saccharopolyspora gloriosae]|uniref:Uncharacterized protein n=1 Tax=Saccharopolyspora gloriosae TaxID=455344 RepID=A0A840NKS4_9PSEU|nr:hypothetical protein [Saccharopolyspora gloriosae]MBB5072480.1 hypothetical protein [Saccharopolyspora gloriosae]